MALSLKYSTGYDSAFDDDTNERKKRETYITDLRDNAASSKQQTKGETVTGTYLSQSGSLARAENKLNFCNYILHLNAHERHKILINQYFLTNKSAFASLVRDTSRDVSDADVLRQNHKFLWEESDDLNDWGARLAKKYYDKLFKEYCICDLSLYKRDKVGMRWRTDIEVKYGEGQFICGEKQCKETSNMRTWEMNFAYVENGQRKNALVKLRLCRYCSWKLNYKNKKKRVKRAKRNVKFDKSTMEKNPEEKQSSIEEKEEVKVEQNIWKEAVVAVSETKEQDDEFEKYLEDLFL